MWRMSWGEGMPIVEFEGVRVLNPWRRVGRRAIVVRDGLGWIGSLTIAASVSGRLGCKC